MKLRAYISPFFLGRYYVIKDIKRLVELYKFEGSLLDYGCGEKPHRSLFRFTDKYLGIDFKQFSHNKDGQSGEPDYYFPEDYTKTWKLPFESNKFDNCVAFQVLEHHASPNDMFTEIHRVIKPGGRLMLTVPFLGGLHEEPHDYQRLTEYAIRNLLEKAGFELCTIKTEGSIFSTISHLYNEYLSSIAGKNRYAYIAVALLLHPFALLGSYSCIILDKIFITNKIFFNYILVAEKI